MILLAVPFTFSAPRSPGMGSRLAVGVIVGLLTLDQLSNHGQSGFAICVERTCFRARFTGSVCVDGVEPWCIGMTDNIKPAVAQHHSGLTLLLQSSKCLNDGIDLLTTVGSVYATAQQRDALQARQVAG